MRFPTAALFFVIACFIFFVLWAVSSYFIGATVDVMSPLAEDLSTDSYRDLLGLLPWAFGIICAIFFVTAIIIIFVLESLSDEPEYYEYRR